MKRILLLGFSIYLLMISLNSTAQDIVCKIKGTLIGRDNNEIVLFPISKLGWTSSTVIPVIDNKFEYDLKLSHIEAYLLVFMD